MILYCTQTYSTIFDFVLHSDVQYDFWFCTVLGRTTWFLILHYTRTYSTIFDLYCTRTYITIFNFVLYSDVQYDFWFCTVLGRTVWFLIYTVLGRTIQFLKIWLWYIIIISNAMNAKMQSNTDCLLMILSLLNWLIMMII